MTRLNRHTIYIAHSLRLRNHVATNVIPVMEKYFEVKNPFADRLELFDNKTEEEIRASREWVNPTWVVKHDLEDIGWCDGMIVINTDGPSYGSTIEASYAFYKEKIPVVFVVEEKYLNHPWLRHYAIGITTDYNEAVEIMRTFFNLPKVVEDESTGT